MPASKLSAGEESVPSLGFVLLNVNAIGDVGWLVNATLNDAEAPAIDVWIAVGVTLKPATSASVFVTLTGVMAWPS